MPYLELTAFIGLIIDAGVIVPSFGPMAEVMVPVLEPKVPLVIDSRASARSKTLPLNIAPNEALWGVDGTVACTAGPSAALWGVIGSGTCDAGDCVVYEDPFEMPLEGPADAKKPQGEAWMS